MPSLRPPEILLNVLGPDRTQKDPDEYIVKVVGRIINEHCECRGQPHARFLAHVTRLSSMTAGTGDCPSGCDSEHVNATVDDEGVIQLPVQPGSSLSNLFERFICTDEIGEVECNTCSVKREVSKTRIIVHPPRVLMFTFKRFDDDMRKKNGHIPFNTVIDIGGLVRRTDSTMQAFDEAGGFTDGGNPILQYELCAITSHIGRSRLRGHHVAYAHRRGIDGQMRWLSCNDQRVTVVSEAVVLAAEAQTLFYRAIRPELVRAFLPRAEARPDLAARQQDEAQSVDSNTSAVGEKRLASQTLPDDGGLDDVGDVGFRRQSAGKGAKKKKKSTTARGASGNALSRQLQAAAARHVRDAQKQREQGQATLSGAKRRR